MILVQTIRDFLFSEPAECWEGTGEMLFAELTEFAEEEGIDTTQQTWPTTAAWLSRRLQGFKRELRAKGIELKRSKEGTGARRQITRLWLVPESDESDTDDQEGQTDFLDSDEPDDDEQDASGEDIDATIAHHHAEAERALQREQEREAARDRIRGCLGTSRANRGKYQGW